MQIGTLVKHIEHDWIGVCVNDRIHEIQAQYPMDLIGGRYAIRWVGVDWNKWDWYSECELEVLCK